MSVVLQKNCEYFLLEICKPLQCKASEAKISELKPPDRAKVLQSQGLQGFSYSPASAFFPYFFPYALDGGENQHAGGPKKPPSGARICAHTSAEIAKILTIRVAVLCPCSSLGALHSPPKRSQRVGRRGMRGFTRCALSARSTPHRSGARCFPW